jgi:hypothetical protein
VVGTGLFLSVVHDALFIAVGVGCNKHSALHHWLCKHPV